MRLGFIERLLQYHEAIPPVGEILNLPCRGIQRAVCSGFGVEGQVILLLLKPGLGFLIDGRYE